MSRASPLVDSYRRVRSFSSAFITIESSSPRKDWLSLWGSIRRRSETVDGDRILYRALHGFAGVGSASVAVLVLSGLVNSWFMVGPDRIAGLLSTPYGLLLTGKLVLFALMLVLAAANRFHLTPDLGSALDDPEYLGPAISRLKRSLVMETLLALGLLALVSIMGTLAPVSAMEMAM